MKEIEFILKLQGYTPAVLCCLFEKPFTVYGDNHGAIAITVSLQLRPYTKHTKIKYHHFWSFVANGNIEIKHVDTKDHITDIFTEPLDYELFGHLHYNLNGW